MVALSYQRYQSEGTRVPLRRRPLCLAPQKFISFGFSRTAAISDILTFVKSQVLNVGSQNMVTLVTGEPELCEVIVVTNFSWMVSNMTELYPKVHHMTHITEMIQCSYQVVLLIIRNTFLYFIRPRKGKHH